jgi:2-isopropylmalate synthase
MAGAKRSVDDMNRIIILDTTLRDGEQAPGMAMTPEEKLAVALMLEKCGVDIIEAGFPVSSQRDFEAVKAIAETVKNCAVSALARVVENDIDRAAEALKDAVKRHIHLSIATSPIHRDKKLRMSRDEVLKKAVNAVRYALTKCDTVEIGAEDATRTEP